MKWEKWWREDATRQGRPCHLLITSRSLWLEGPTQMRTVVVLIPQGIHQSTLRVWMMHDRTELTQFKTGSHCCKSGFCEVKSLKPASPRQRMASVSESSKVNCLSSSLWGELLCSATVLCFIRLHSNSVSLGFCIADHAGLGGYYHWHCNGVVTNFKTHLFNYTCEPRDN